MNLKSPRLEDKLNTIALATIFAIVVSVLCAAVSVLADSSSSTTVASTTSVTLR